MNKENQVIVDLDVLEQMKRLSKEATRLCVKNQFYGLIFKTIAEMDDLDSIKKLCESCVDIEENNKWINF